METTDRNIAKKLLQVDQHAEWSGAEKFEVFCGSLTPIEREHPLGEWILLRRHTLDWEDNIGQFLTAFWGLPRRPWVLGENTADAVRYHEALAALLTQLEKEEKLRHA